MTTEYERGFADAIRMAAEVCDDLQDYGLQIDKEILALRPEPVSNELEPVAWMNESGGVCRWQRNGPFTYHIPLYLHPTPNVESEPVGTVKLTAIEKDILHTSLRASVKVVNEREPVVCVNDDKWNCKYCRKTGTCEALNDTRNFGNAITNAESEMTFDEWFDAEYPMDEQGSRNRYRNSSVMELMTAAWNAAKEARK